MPHFTEEQLKELETIFGLMRTNPDDLYTVRDGVVKKGDKVWWRCDTGPELQTAGEPKNISNMRQYPQYYSIAKPRFTINYED